MCGERHTRVRDVQVAIIRYSHEFVKSEGQRDAEWLLSRVECDEMRVFPGAAATTSQRGDFVIPICGILMVRIMRATVECARMWCRSTTD